MTSRRFVLIVVLIAMCAAGAYLHATMKARSVRRQHHNRASLQECSPEFGQRVSSVLFALERDGYKPYVMESWRSKEEQLALYLDGSSNVLEGFHNLSDDCGRHRAMAVDIYSDSFWYSEPSFLLALAKHAREAGLTTGIGWGLTREQQDRVDRHIESTRRMPLVPLVVKLGWDPHHVEVAGISFEAAKRAAGSCE